MKTEQTTAEAEAREAARCEHFGDTTPCDCSHCGDFNAGFDAAKAFYEPKWTAVEDGLPERGEWVLLTDRGGEILCGRRSPYGQDRFIVGTEVGNAYYAHEHIIAWMPLPPPYQSAAQTGEKVKFDAGDCMPPSYEDV